MHIELIGELRETIDNAARRQRCDVIQGAVKRSKLKMVNVSRYAGSKFIKVDDVREKPREERIINVYLGQRYGRPILELDSGREFSLNGTNVSVLMKAYGEESNAWLGHTIELSFGHTMFEKQTVETVVVKPISLPEHFPDGKPPDAPQPRPAPQRQEPPSDMDDEIPF